MAGDAMIKVEGEAGIVQIKAIVPKPIRPVARSIYFGLYRLLVKAQCWYSDRRDRTTDVDSSVIPPAMLRFRVAETTSVQSFVAVGRETAKCVENALESVGRPFDSFQSVLDFGCGCGRTLIHFTRKFPGKALHGTDVDIESINWCRTHLPNTYLTVNDSLPPICYPDQHFDLVYCISVFTHLSEDHQCRWLSELHRVIKPGGILLVTVHGPQTWKNLSTEDFERFQQKGFLFKTSSKLTGIVPSWYHTAYHCREYVLQTFSPMFTPLTYLEAGLGYQDLVILQR